MTCGTYTIQSSLNAFVILVQRIARIHVFNNYILKQKRTLFPNSRNNLKTSGGKR